MIYLIFNIFVINFLSYIIEHFQMEHIQFPKQNLTIPDNEQEISGELKILLDKNEAVIRKYISRHIFLSDISFETNQQLDELSKNLLSRYKRAASRDQGHAYVKDDELGIEHQKVKRLMANTNKGAPGMRGSNPISKTNAPAVHKALSKASDEIQKMRNPLIARIDKRRAGMELATKKMGKGPGARSVVKGTGKLSEEFELDERTLTAPETAEKERMVKGMKKSLAGFKQRYGEKAKSVMYATATARAKEKK